MGGDIGAAAKPHIALALHMIQQLDQADYGDGLPEFAGED
jgi:hypothetical protein